MPSVAWYGSPNFTPGRIDVEYVVIHWMDGYLAGADATFQNTTRQTSAHYGVEDDVIHQYVDEANTAWHAGNYDANTRSIGIEHSAMPGRPASDATYASTIWLITGICQRYGLDPSVAILPHQHFTATSCPGTMDLPRIIAGVQAALGGISTQSGTITPITEGFLMALTDDQQQQIWDILVGSQQVNFAKVIAAQTAGAVSPPLKLLTDRQLENHLVTQQKLDGNHLTAMQKADGNHSAVMAALLSIAQGVGDLKANPAAAAPVIDVPALAAQIAAALNTNQAHDFLVAFRNALPAN